MKKHKLFLILSGLYFVLITHIYLAFFSVYLFVFEDRHLTVRIAELYLLALIIGVFLYSRKFKHVVKDILGEKYIPIISFASYFIAIVVVSFIVIFSTFFIWVSVEFQRVGK